MSKQNNVSCRALEPFVAHFTMWDEKYSEQFGQNLKYLRDSSNIIAWEKFVEFLEHYSYEFGDDAVVESQKQHILDKGFSGLKTLQLMATPKLLYKLQTRWMGPMMFPCVKSVMSKTLNSNIEIYLETPEPFSPLFLESAKIFLTYLPTLIGYPEALVTAEIKDNVGFYTILLPQSRTIFSKLKQFFSFFLGGRQVASELSYQQEKIRSAYMDLEHTHKQLENTAETLRDLKEQFQLAVQGSNDGIWDWNLDSNRMYFSDRWQIIMGYDPETNIVNTKEDWFYRVYEKDLPRVMEAIDEHIAGKTEYLNIKFRIDAPRYPEKKWGLVKGKVILNEEGHPYRMAGSLSDITEFVDISRDLNYTIQSYHAVLRHSPDGALIYNEEEILSANPAMLDFLGYDRLDELVGSSILKISDSFSSFFEPEIRRLRGDEGSIVPFLLRSGGKKDGEVSALKVQYEKKIVNCILVRDITSRRILEQKLQAVERVIAVGTMASGIAHEINNPMAYIHSNVEYVKEELHTLEEKFRKGKIEDLKAFFSDLDAALDDTINGSKRVRTIVKDLKSLSHSSENETLRPIDVIPIVDSSIQMVMHKINPKARLVTRFHRTPPAMFAEGRLGQVVLNLLVNAAQAIKKGGPDDNEIRVTTEATDNEVLIRISDTGNGIPLLLRNKIFDPFFTTKPAGEGTGLGLSICNNIMKRLGGDISFETETGVGTTFTIHIPRAEDKDISVSNLSVAQHHILVVDDDEKIGIMMRRLLQPAYRITYVNSAIEAIGTLEEISDIDLIICDAMMPEMSGYDLLDKLKINRLDMMKHFILMTGGRLETDRFGQYKDAFDTPILFKPFDLDELKTTIAHQMRD